VRVDNRHRDSAHRRKGRRHQPARPRALELQHRTENGVPGRTGGQQLPARPRGMIRTVRT